MSSDEITLKLEKSPYHMYRLLFDFSYGCTKFYEIKDQVKEDIDAEWNGEDWYLPISNIDQPTWERVEKFIDDYDYRINKNINKPRIERHLNHDVVVNKADRIYISMKWKCDNFDQMKNRLSGIGCDWNNNGNKVWQYSGVKNDVYQALNKFDNVFFNFDVKENSSSEFHLDDFDGELMDFQKRALEFVKDNNYRALLGHEVGLGKTVIAISAFEDSDAYPFLIVCPASLKLKWKSEIEDFLPGKHVYVMNGQDGIVPSKCDAYICNYRILEHRIDDICDLGIKGVAGDEGHAIKDPTTNQTKAMQNIRQAVDPDVRLLLTATPFQNSVDEIAEPIKWLGLMPRFGGESNFITEYCKAKYAVIIACKGHKYKKLKSLLKNMGATHSGSGTKYHLPASKKDEFWSRINSSTVLNPGDFKNFPEYDEYDPDDPEDQKRMSELNRALTEEVMERELKENVKDELPDKTTNIIPVEINHSEYMQKEAEAIQEIEDRHHKKVKRLENRLEKTINNLEDKHGTPIRNIRQQSLEGAKRVDELDEKITNLKNRGPTIHLPLISELRQYVAKRKVPAVTQWAENIDEQIIIFGRHNAILDELNNNLDDSAVYDGNTNDKVAEQMKKDYRNGDLKVFIGQIQACGEGIELVKGSRTNIAFIEAPWNPQVVYQAEGRAYARLGDWSGINSNYFICEDTVDSDIFDTLDKKASIFNNVVDDKQAEGDFDTSSVQEEVLEKMKQRQGVN